MTRTLAILTAALALVLAWSASALGSIEGVPEFTLAPFTKAQGGAGNAVSLTMNWAPPTFLGGSNNHQDIWLTQGGSTTKYGPFGATAGTASGFIIGNGQPLDVKVLACSASGLCPSPDVGTAETTHSTMVDGTPPSGTVAIDGGAPATNDRNVTLTLQATDPLINGAPGTSSGITQYAVDQDGDGTFPCDLFILNGSTPDRSGCARTFAPTGTATLTAPGDGIKTLGVQFGDGARVPTAPCKSPFCAVLLGADPILGNVSPTATDTILLDTVKPAVVLTQDRSGVTRGGSVSFDATGSTDATSPTPSGIDPGATRWDFKDGTPVASGLKVTHEFDTAGTFVGEVRVRDVAGNFSDPTTFTVTVTPKPGETINGSGSIAGITGSANFSLTRLTVRAHYRKSRLVGSIRLAGAAGAPGVLTTEIRPALGSRLLARRRTRLTQAAFTKVVALPATLLPGDYRVAFIGPGGTLTTTLTLTAPREGVLRSATLHRAGTPRARFVFAAQPVRALRSHLSVLWTLGGHRLALLPVGGGRVVTSVLPGPVAGGTLVATLKAGTRVVGAVRAR